MDAEIGQLALFPEQRHGQAIRDRRTQLFTHGLTDLSRSAPDHSVTVRFAVEQSTLQWRVGRPQSWCDIQQGHSRDGPPAAENLNTKNHLLMVTLQGLGECRIVCLSMAAG